MPGSARFTPEFFQAEDVFDIAKALLGAELCVQQPDGSVCSGRIVETEAYNGPTDRASHAHGWRRTARTEVMYSPGGVAYVYLCYGLHHLFNVVTHQQDQPFAVLVRAVEPLAGIETMLPRRKMTQPQPRLTAGPGALTQALGITRQHNGLPLWGNDIWLVPAAKPARPDEIVSSPRVGVAYAGPDAAHPWRYRLKGSTWTSPAR